MELILVYHKNGGKKVVSMPDWTLSWQGRVREFSSKRAFEIPIKSLSNRPVEWRIPDEGIRT